MAAAVVWRWWWWRWLCGGGGGGGGGGVAVVVAVVAAAARPGSCREITYVVGSCSRARALRAAADGCAVWRGNGGVATMAAGRGSSRGCGEWWSRQLDLNLDRAQSGDDGRQLRLNHGRAPFGQPPVLHNHLRYTVTAASWDTTGTPRAAAVFRYPPRSPLLGEPFKGAGCSPSRLGRPPVCLFRSLSLLVCSARQTLCLFARLLVCLFRSFSLLICSARLLWLSWEWTHVLLSTCGWFHARRTNVRPGVDSFLWRMFGLASAPQINLYSLYSSFQQC